MHAFPRKCHVSTRLPEGGAAHTIMLGLGLANVPLPTIALPPDAPANIILPFVLGPLFLLACEYVQRPAGLDGIFVRPGVGAYGVGLIAIRPVPVGGVICSCSCDNADPVPGRRLNFLRPSVRTTVLELYDGWDGKGNFQVPTNYDQAIPLISFINHSPEPNCIYLEEINCIVSQRKLRTGEECTVDYLQYQEKGSYTWRAAASGFRRTPRIL